VTTPIAVTLFHHKEATWPQYLREYTSLSDLEKQGLIAVSVGKLPEQNKSLAFARLPERLRRLLFFAKPDVVVSIDDGQKPVQPIFAFDVTEHVAARDHWIQRFPNLVGCAQENIPGAFIAPRDMPEREGFAGRTDPFFFYAYDRVIEIHQTPIYIAEWRSTDGAHLDTDPKYGDLPPHDSEGMTRTIAFFDLVLDAAIKGRDLSTLMRERQIVDLRDDLRKTGYQKIPQISDFSRLSANMPDRRPLTRDEFSDWLNRRNLSVPDDLPDRILKRDAYLIFSPLVNPDAPDAREGLKKRIKLKGGDPYTQQPLVFDYLFCRLGPSVSERDVNLVIDLSVLRFADFAEYVKTIWDASPLQFDSFKKVRPKVPIYTLHLTSGVNQVMKNFVRLYAFAADVIVFDDGVLYF
jgi:hypothetical protein